MSDGIVCLHAAMRVGPGHNSIVGKLGMTMHDDPPAKDSFTTPEFLCLLHVEACRVRAAVHVYAVLWNSCLA